jgi:hypothetical protein
MLFNDIGKPLPDDGGKDGLRNVEILWLTIQEDFIMFKNSVPTSQKGRLNVGFEVITALTMQSTIFRGVTPCSPVEVY